MSKCSHTIGHYETDRYDSMETTFVELEEAATLKKGDATLYNFCPHCGLDLKGLLDAKIEELKAIKLAEKQKEEKERAAREVQFNKTVAELSVKTKLNLLPEGSFVVLLNPFKAHDSRDYLLMGPKDLILRNTVNATMYEVKARETLTVKAIYKMPSINVVEKVLLAQGFKNISTTTTPHFERAVEKKTERLSYSDGMIYITIKKIDSEGDSHTNYEHFSVLRLGDYLGVEFLLETVELMESNG